ncbi:putative oxygen-independent coproporphyrinogen III oxidase [Aequorivita sublithincola DSM 14238]|uniref:Heme chaperone HemW n=1 Tax=Aequorivita sublithincola (strain DSM 14238 / LMG 21431 / ACAM 643 / 9-3) TaxID=746697 RepID=I3YVT5_AEQSU|nr:radical SAM family heme chaperone HemW [Aequorivita sublithincola]AFL81103.1 putative oxygen-independent coproporphyrinogen III oxidase [Aequorivita sublithincola DSM 14238]
MKNNSENIESNTNGAGIYIHIPFCKQACHYCDFHFSTSIKKKGELVDALCKELVLRRDEIEGRIETIYFGGGTPSLLSSEELKQIFKAIYENYKVSENPEITLEANPDDLIDVSLSASDSYRIEDLSKIKLKALKEAGINRLSIGIQSFFQEDLKLMNRAHNATEALGCIAEAKKYFENISIDLIYGIPGMTNERWKKNLEIALNLDVPHLSCYALTVEPKTALKKFIDKGIVPPVDEDVAKQHYEILVEETEKAGLDNYEFSNFGKPGFHSRNNTAYWEGKPYLGIGPSAHGYDGKSRTWNVSNNTKYIKSIEAGILPSESETLSKKDKYNEYIMTGLRTKKGVSLEKIESDFGKNYSEYLLKQAENPIRNEFLILENQTLKVSKKGKFLSDGIASDLFCV